METYIILLTVLGMLLQMAFIYVEHEEKFIPAVILKGSASLVFILIGALSFIYAKSSVLVFIGLILGGIGDVLLNLRFVFTKIGSKIFLGGVASFLIGHILYLIAIINDATPFWWCFLIGVVIAAVTLVIIFKVLDVKLSYKIFGILYIGAVSLMASMAFGNLIVGYSKNTFLYAIGALMFLVSDIVLIFNSFGKNPKFILRITNLSFYYIGQILIALSLYFLGQF